MNDDYTTARGTHPTPAEIEAYIASARRLRAQAMAQMTGNLIMRIKEGLRSLHASTPPHASHCPNC